MRRRYLSTRRAPTIGGAEVERVGADALVGVLALAPPMPAGLKDWWAPRWNVAPTQPVRAITARDGPPRLTLARWSLTMPSHGAKRPQLADVRAETALLKPLLRHALARRRCLVLADGFYGWRGEGEARCPVRFAPRDDPRADGAGAGDGRALTFAAIARGRQHEGHWLEELAILTTAADALVAPVDDQQPVVIAAAERERWLDRDVAPEALVELLAPRPLTGWLATDAPRWLDSARVEAAAAEPGPPVQPSLFG
ncbi:MAG TPA: SOS response-associated peptidase family protein [Kofleriaceae bacterium]|nr:SOS response-associated peptidase family protein [Kofleriaceae bacterium]